jgi:hypothetical protein
MYDLAVIDTLPLTAVSDAPSLPRKVSGIASMGRICREGPVLSSVRWWPTASR